MVVWVSKQPAVPMPTLSKLGNVLSHGSGGLPLRAFGATFRHYARLRSAFTRTPNFQASSLRWQFDGSYFYPVTSTGKAAEKRCISTFQRTLTSNLTAQPTGYFNLRPADPPYQLRNPTGKDVMSVFTRGRSAEADILEACIPSLMTQDRVKEIARQQKASNVEHVEPHLPFFLDSIERTRVILPTIQVRKGLQGT